MHNANMFQLNSHHNLICKSRAATTQGGGVGIFVNKNLKFKELPELSIFIDKVIETIFIEVELPNKSKIIVGSLYRPNSAHINLTPSQQLEQFIESMHSILSKIINSGKKAYLFGDINIDILKIDSHKQSCDYVNSLFSLGFLQLITATTICIHNSSTLIDHIVTNDMQPLYECGALTNRISDHFPIFYILNTSKPKNGQKSIRTRHINPENTQKFKQLLNSMPWPETLESEDPQVSLDCFLKTFLDLYNLHFPEKTTRF